MVDEYQDTNRPQYLLIRRLAEVHRNLCVVGDPDQSIYKWRGADLRNILDFEQDFPRSRRSSSSNATTARRRSFSTPRRRSSARTATARTSTSGPTARAAPASSTSAAATSSRRPTSSRARRAPAGRRCRRDGRVLYRTNAQSRTIEDALMREGLAYKIVGGVRFYERKEIKDALAYMRLVINPHDDVSLRRVINVPARGIGKGVMEALEKVEPTGERRRRPAAARRPGLQPALSANSLWARLVRGLEERAFTGRAAASLTVVPRSDRQPDRDRAAGLGVDRHRQDARPQRLPAGSARGSQRGRRSAHREPRRAGVGGARVREPRARAVARRLRRSPVAALRRRRRAGHARRPHLADDAAQRQGARVPDGDPRRPRGRAVPALAVDARTRRSSRRSGGSATSA